MTKKEVVKAAITHQKPPYVPWQSGFTEEARHVLIDYFGGDFIEERVQNHFALLGNDPLGFVEDLGNDLFRDVYGVVWDRSVDRDIGVVKKILLPEPTLEDFSFPDSMNPIIYLGNDKSLTLYPDRWNLWQVGFSLYERAWSLRGMENLMVDFYENPDFVHELFNGIVEYDIAVMTEALKRYEIDAFFFGDDWGMQTGLQMGLPLWREFIKPYAARLYKFAHDNGKFVHIHSCGKVEELFPELIEMGVNSFNPFQPEVMDVHKLMREYHGRLAFHGGLSLQKTLPYGTVEDVKRETQALIDSGANGGYIFAPAHWVEGDVPLRNMLAFIETLQDQPGAPKGL